MIEAHAHTAVVDVHHHSTEKAILWKELSLNQLSYAGWHELAAELTTPAILFGCCSCGKKVVLKIAFQMLNQYEARFKFERGRKEEATEIYFLEQVPIGEVDALLQSIVLRNEGGTSIDNRLDLSDVERLNASATYFPLRLPPPPSSYPVPSQSSSSSSLEISPHQPSIRKQPPRVSVIERMTKSQGIQIASRLVQFRPALEKERNEENQFLLAMAKQPVDPLIAADASTLQLRTLTSRIQLNETTKQALDIAGQI
ncbi:uncharacterized protein MONOS_15086 [Monocercomonoides exilis]|uniref:uncharacterized protein n=1 Tax=Monocercomonoides exilis TaxID=2049356 RepID=UPI00355A21A5|nr:hypothetical protein MONOS_15086 [Monocercomonoides exilis]|eukprot:MONOS_15086.1-p1 / transcript=MONOS_15086.1 / gene=MONOS_15086 / organism=Monocercomonoides_exilis_PA203 / gene_product=unspecified product / transcript_product=unspecified product / location=Mono_scaffold01140:9942-11102(+) / protein_length=256 / sequence_SO=supercontig / SO=protein_coding / is_pseudo=false